MNTERYVERHLFDEMKRLFYAGLDAEVKANELLVLTWRSLDYHDFRRGPLEEYFREVGMYVDGKVFE